MKTIIRSGLLVAAAAVVATVAITQVREERSPASPGDRDGRTVRVPEVAPPRPREQAPLRVDTFQVQRIATGSDLGAAGDLLVTFQGQGFMLTSRAPRLLLGAGLALETTEINRDGTELYVVIARGVQPRIEAMRFDSVVVANPGARQDTRFGQTRVRATPARLLRPDPDAPAVRVVYRDGAFSREPVRQ